MGHDVFDIIVCQVDTRHVSIIEMRMTLSIILPRPVVRSEHWSRPVIEQRPHIDQETSRTQHVVNDLEDFNNVVKYSDILSWLEDNGLASLLFGSAGLIPDGRKRRWDSGSDISRN
jgi:hypothetical protein